MKTEQEVIETSKEVQEFFLSVFLAEPSAYSRCQSIIKEEYFDRALRPAVKFIMEYVDEYKGLPKPELVKAATGVDVGRDGTTVTESDVNFVLKGVESFCRHKAMEGVLMAASDLHSAGNYSTIEEMFKESVNISLQTDLGTDYYHDPLTRLLAMRDRSEVVSTGWASLDKILYGGFNKGSLNIFVAGSGVGKSLFLQNLAVNYSQAGLDALYITLELSENLVSNRIDAMVTKTATREFYKDYNKVATSINIARMQNKGKLIIKKMSEAGTTAQTLRAFLKEYEVKHGKYPDVLLVDYLDLMSPNDKRIDKSNLFGKDKFVSEELRAISGDLNIVTVTASQLNRGAIAAVGEYDHSHISGGISKIQTADNVFSVHQTPPMKEKGIFALGVLKARTAACTGYKLELAYDIDTMRITDMDHTVKLDDAPGQMASSAYRSNSTHPVAKLLPNAVRTSRV